MHIDRLLTLAKQLSKKKNPRTFMMRQWAIDEHGCITAACAGGEAALLPEFRKLGLELIKDLGHWHIRFEGKFNEYALARFFDITGRQSLTIFMPASYRSFSRIQVARRIKSMIRLEKTKGFAMMALKSPEPNLVTLYSQSTF